MPRRWRVYHPDARPDIGSEISLRRSEAHHVRGVLRLRTGDSVAVFDGRGREVEGTLVRVDKEQVVIRAERELLEPVEPPIEIRLIQGLCRPDRMDWVVQKATEIGVAAIEPTPTSRAESFKVGPARIERWQRIAIEACKQSGRRQVPEILLRDALPGGAVDGVGLVLDPLQPAEAIEALSPPPPEGRIFLVVGPEGGLDASEIASLVGAGWRGLGLGPRVLRAETAGIVAAAVLLHRWGDLARRHPPV
jgi:16S rRNA (uracil1498-N3)-methyltransferase